MVQLTQCRRVLLDSPTFQNSPAWNIHPLLCEDVTIDKAACPEGAAIFLTVRGVKTGGIHLLNTDTSRAGKAVELVRGATPEAVATH
jgi:hypothetical protein